MLYCIIAVLYYYVLSVSYFSTYFNFNLLFLSNRARRACDTGCERVLEVVPTSIRPSLVQPTCLTGHPVATIIKVGHHFGPPVSQGTCHNHLFFLFSTYASIQHVLWDDASGDKPSPTLLFNNFY